MTILWPLSHPWCLHCSKFKLTTGWLNVHMKYTIRVPGPWYKLKWCISVLPKVLRNTGLWSLLCEKEGEVFKYISETLPTTFLLEDLLRTVWNIWDALEPKILLVWSSPCLEMTNYSLYSYVVIQCVQKWVQRTDGRRTECVEVFLYVLW